MIKQEYMKPTLEVLNTETDEMLASSVTTEGLDGTQLEYDGTSDNSWENAW